VDGAWWVTSGIHYLLALSIERRRREMRDASGLDIERRARY
jgi:hypothetical protein